MKLGLRRLVLAGLLTATLAAAAWMSEDTDRGNAEIVAVAQNETARASPPSRSGPRTEPAQVNLEKFKSHKFGETARDPFAMPAPRVRPKPVPPSAAAAAVAAPAPPPTAPPLPFTYLGKLRSAQDSAVFLTQGERNLVVREGDTIDSLYRVEHVAKSEITLVYLPLDQRQTLFIGESP